MSRFVLMVAIGQPRRGVNLRALRAPLQVAVTCGLLALMWRMGGGAALLDRLAGADPWWVVAGLAFATLATGFAALRWRYTASCIGAGMTVSESVREFYLASFLNQVLPTGILGDAVRAVRHGRRTTQEDSGLGPAVRAVIIERMANQVVISILMLISLTLWIWMPSAFGRGHVWLPPLVGAALVGAALAIITALARRQARGHIERFLRDVVRALLRPRTFATQLGLGFLVTGSCIAMFFCAAHAVHAPLSAYHLLALTPGALYAMSIPISIGGWGLREAAAVTLWTMAGLPPGEAMATSVLYGMLSLMAALPGAIVLAADR